MAKSKFPKLKPGDPLRITWWDIVSDAVGDMADAKPALCETLGYFWKYSGRGKSRSLVAGLTIFPKEENSEPRGWDAYPVGCIEKIEIVGGILVDPVFKRDKNAEVFPKKI